MGNFSFLWTGEIIIFFVFALSIICGGVCMLYFHKIVHMVACMMVSFLGLAGIYVLLEAEFVAFVQVLVYAGAISILVLFGIMMTKHDKQDEVYVNKRKKILAFSGCFMLFSILFVSIQEVEFIPARNVSLIQNNTFQLGKQLFTEHVLSFELLSVVLMGAFIGAIVLTKKEEFDATSNT